ncbi:MAG: serine/threonine protein kinase, partial [Enterovirga sp.]|nr:serine/threonine protein kinase [Enterovirga sp.]
MKEPSEFPTHFPGQIRPGTRLSGIYEVDSLLAVGGMGEVYRGRAIETDIQVAIKVVKAEHTQSETVLALFKKEAAALHNLQHDAIVRYYVFTTDPVLHVPYLAMELVEGESLSDIIARGPLPIESVLLLQRRIASALDTAHRAGVVHRDISPDNIILPGRDPARAKLIDFGIARSAFGGGTVIGDRFAGKQNYASPEQVGLFGATVGPKSDIYSLGLTLAAAALGAPLDMGGTQLDVIRKRQALPDLRQTDPLIRPLLLKMLQPKPDDRPAGMAEVAEWRPGGRGGDRKPGERRWLVPALAGAVVVLAAGAGALGWLQLRESPSSPAASRQAAAPASSRPGELPPSYAAPGAAQQPGSGLTLPPPSVTPAEAPAELSSRQPAGGVALGPATPPPAAGPQPGVAV